MVDVLTDGKMKIGACKLPGRKKPCLYIETGNEVMVEFMCARCKKTALRPLKDCLPPDSPVHTLPYLKAPPKWRDGDFYYPTFCPECAEKYDKFMEGEDSDK